MDPMGVSVSELATEEKMMVPDVPRFRTPPVGVHPVSRVKPGREATVWPTQVWYHGLLRGFVLMPTPKAVRMCGHVGLPAPCPVRSDPGTLQTNRPQYC